MSKENEGRKCVHRLDTDRVGECEMITCLQAGRDIKRVSMEERE